MSLLIPASFRAAISSIAVARPLSDMQYERHRPRLERGHQLLRRWFSHRLIMVELVSGHGRMTVHVPPRLRLAHWWRTHYQQILQVLPAGQLPSVLGPVRFCGGRHFPVLLCLLRFVRRSRRNAHHGFLVAEIVWKIIVFMHLKRDKRQLQKKKKYINISYIVFLSWIVITS